MASRLLSRACLGHRIQKCSCVRDISFLRSLVTCKRTRLKLTFNYSTYIPNHRNYSTCIRNRYILQLQDLTNSKCLHFYIRRLRYSDETKAETSDNISKKDEKQSDNKTKSKWFSSENAWKIGLLSLGCWAIAMCGSFIVLWGNPRVDDEGREIPDEFSEGNRYIGYIRRAINEAFFLQKMIQDPSSEKLLPDPLPEPYYQPPYTLILEMTGVLVHPDWTYGTGWRFKKRPGVDAFLKSVGPPLFEVVIYTSETAFTAFPLLDSLDPDGHIMYRLFRDATRYIDGHHVKDLSCLNRDLSKVIIVDWNPKSYNLQPRNALRIDKWTGSNDDFTLVGLADFLKMIVANGVDDVREVLDYYNKFPDPIAAYHENLRRFQEEQEKLKIADQSKATSPFFKPSWGRKPL